MQEMVRIMSEQAAVIDSLQLPTPPLEDNPQNNPIQIITQPDLQDILTKDEPDLTEIVKLKDEIADVQTMYQICRLLRVKLAVKELT